MKLRKPIIYVLLVAVGLMTQLSVRETGILAAPIPLEHPVSQNGNTPKGIAFSDDFSSDPNTSGNWTIHRFWNDYANEASWDASQKNFYLVRSVDWKATAAFAMYDLTATNWQASFRYKVGGGSNPGADGFVFMFYKDKQAYGGPAPGGSLGFDLYQANTPVPISGYGIEFDTYYNWEKDPTSAPHIALIKDSAANHLTYITQTKIDDNEWHSALVAFVNGHVTLDVDNELVLNYQVDTPDYTHTGIGFAAADATFTNDHIIDDFVLTVPSNTAIDYFALGDSIASGRGLMDDTNSGGNVDGCRQSDLSYPIKMKAMLEQRYSQVNFHFFACDGATAVQPTDQDLLTRFPHKWFSYQVNDALAIMPTDRPVLVTMTIGVNDMGWDPFDIPNLVKWLYDADGDAYSRHVDDLVSQVLVRVKKQVKRLLAKPNVAIVMTDYPNPANKQSLLFYFAKDPSKDPYCVVFASKCYARTEELVHKVNGIPLTIWKDLKPTERARFQPIAVHELFHGHETPKGLGGCGLAKPNIANTWIQYPSDQSSNSKPQFPKWLRKLINKNQSVPLILGDCFHPNERGAEQYAKKVNEGAKKIGR